jgi:hypothetical protein
MKSSERPILFAQLFASICLGISCFLPFYKSAVGDAEYVNGIWFYFFWVIPVVFIAYILSNRWLRTIFCLFSIIAGLFSLIMYSFMANFKSTPLIGFQIASASIIVLVIGWLVLIVITLAAPKDTPTKTGIQARIEKLILYGLLGAFITAIVAAIGWKVAMKIPVLHAQYAKSSGTPEVVLGTFFRALIEDDLDLAKELVSPELRPRLDQWKIESQYTELHCPCTECRGMHSSRSNPIVTYTTPDQAVSEIMEFSCWYGDGASLSLWDTTLEYDGHEWLVTDWKKICTETSKFMSMKCYQ